MRAMAAFPHAGRCQRDRCAAQASPDWASRVSLQKGCGDVDDQRAYPWQVRWTLKVGAPRARTTIRS